MEVVVVPLIYSVVINNAFAVQKLCVHLFTYKYKFSLCKVWNTVLCKSRCKTCFGNFVNISAAL